MKQRLKDIGFFLRDNAGGTLTLTAVVFPAVIGFSGLALDGAHWYAERRSTQSMADAAAVAGAYAKVANDSLTAIESTVMDEAERNGYENVAANSLTVNDVSTAAATTSARPLIEVTIRRQVPLYFANVFFEDTTIGIAARAVSGVRNLGPQCVIALNETASRAVEFTGNTTADIGCGVASNSDSDEALYIGGSAVLVANPAQAFGDIAVDGSGELVSQLPPLPFSPRVDDPYADLPPPPTTSCDHSDNRFVVTENGVLEDTDGDGYITVCGDLELDGNIDLDAGTYIVRNGDYSTKGGTSVSGTDVTVILTGDTPGDVGSVRLNNNTTMTLTAPQSGVYEGVLFYQDPNALDPDRSLFNGGVNLELNGVIYMPAGAIDFSGGASNPNNCLQIVGDTVSFTGNSFIRNDETVCSDLGLADGGTTQKQVVLLE